jgi:imidazolonepropionase-like amidohydrolase
VNAAAALAVDPQLGRIATGAVADFILVDGDPLRQVDDLLHVVAVVRNGRFFSVAGLIERAASAENVE